jgi:hypothetical protein
MDILRTIATLLPLAITSGINLYATVLVAGLCIHFGWVQNTPAALEPLGTWPVIIVAGILFLIEALVDKIPFLDTAWDILHTLIRPLGSAILGFIVLGKADPALVIIGALAMGSITLISHGGKASTRASLNIMSPLEGCSNFTLSSLEDVLAGLLTFITLQYPYVAFGITLAILLGILIFAPRLIRWTFYTLQSLVKWIKGTFYQVEAPDVLPEAHQKLLQPARIEFSLECMAQNGKGVSGNSGYLSLAEELVAFTCLGSWGKDLAWQVPMRCVKSGALQKRGLMDVIEIEYADEQNAAHVARFTVQKDRSALAGRFVNELHSAVQR